MSNEGKPIPPQGGSATVRPNFIYIPDVKVKDYDSAALLLKEEDALRKNILKVEEENKERYLRKKKWILVKRHTETPSKVWHKCVLLKGEEIITSYSYPRLNDAFDEQYRLERMGLEQVEESNSKSNYQELLERTIFSDIAEDNS